MKRALRIIAVLWCCHAFNAAAQLTEPFIYGWGSENLIKKDTSRAYYRLNKNRIFYIDKEYRLYKIFDADYTLIETGEIGRSCVDCPSRAGRCTAYYPNGKVKTSGYYNHRGQIVGTWRTFYPDGQLRHLYTYDVALPGLQTGSDETYYENGRIEHTGFYCINHNDTLSVDSVMTVDPRTGDTHWMISHGPGNISVPCGVWMYYDVNGALLKRENYD